MLKPMPLKFIGVVKVTNLDNFFGFCKVKVSCPSHVKRPLLPVKYKGKTIFPTGKWTGTYFSEELKALKTHIPDYQFDIIEGYSFTKANIFQKYVLSIYKVKQESSGSSRWIAKLLLNCLYGTFGRKRDLHTCMNVHASELINYLDKYVVTSLIDLGDDMFTIILQNNINLKLLNELNNTVSTNHKFTNSNQFVMNNVAIASATTSYARIVMMPYKLDPTCVYSDTDSVFTKNILNIIKEGLDLGEFKDELQGIKIKKAIFLGIKQYGYKYLESGRIVEKSVFCWCTKKLFIL